MNRRHRRRRRRTKLWMLAAAAIVIVAVVLIAVLSGKKSPATDSGDISDPVPADTNVDQPVTPEDDTPEEPPKEPYQTIAITGDQEQYDALYRIGDTGFEMYTYVDGVAQKYAEAVNRTADALAGKASVYVLPVPLSSGITLPDALLGNNLFDDQAAAEEKIGAMLNASVHYVPLNDALMRHRTEYIYFRTDHHWTALGAYYAYRAFCGEKGITPHELRDYTKDEFAGFLGSFYRDSNQNDQMAAHPDVVEAWHPVTTEAMLDFTDTAGNTLRWKIIYDATDYEAGMKYNTFIAGDQPFTVINNPDVTDQSKCVVVKESFGNAFVPYLVDHYSTVYVIDYRYWGGDSLTDFVRENGVQDVVFVNNLSAIRSSYLIGKLQDIT